MSESRNGKPALKMERSKKPVLITGGAGFIGANLAHRLLSAGRPVLIFDNLSRPGVERNLQWLVETYGSLVRVEVSDTRDLDALHAAVKQAAQVFHFAAQVAVTTSLVDPISDFKVNARGTLNLLEAIRAQENQLPLVFTSTNKVYGALDDIELSKESSRYQPVDAELRARGISEARSVDFHSPYGCSKGAADQYVLDYARTFALPAVVFRMSCIYGPHQFGTEDQGWVAHFLIRAIENQPITLYGDGLQVRDLLFVEDLVDAFLLAQENIEELSGQAFNIGGGPENAISLRELIDFIGDLHGESYAVEFAPWRNADQRYYVSDTGKFHSATGWKPRVGVRDGVERLYQWLLEARGLSKAPRVGGREGMKHPRTTSFGVAASRG
jgi:CDP-paratose 2-epimerase